MRNRTKFICAILIFIIFVMSVYFIYKNKSTLQLKFINSYGSINCISGSNQHITLAFFSKGNTKELDSVNTLFINDNLEVSNLIVTKSMAIWDISLWYLNFDLSVKNKGVSDEILIRDIVFNSKKYNIGQLKINVIAYKDQNEFLIKECTGTFLGAGLSNYYAILENKGQNLITINDVKAEMFDNIPIEIFVNEKEYEGLTNLELKSGDKFEFDMMLKNYKKIKADAYYVSPIIIYRTEQKKKIYYFDCYISGINLNKSEFKQLSKNYFK